MDVKKEAKELIDKFRKHVDCDLSGEDGFEYSKDAETYNAKQCALIVIKEVLSIPYLLKEEIFFYKELKKEIEKS
jgi:hypothetical protein